MPTATPTATPTAIGIPKATPPVWAGIGIVLVAAAAMVGGWLLFWHMADDAYITYRYLSNSMLGRGLVWNPAPFLPVDGNTDFLWSLLLLGIWRVFGVMPPDIANWLSLGFGCGTLVLLARAVWRVELPERLARVRTVLLVLALASLVGNRAFLASLSSGLGVASFNLSLFAWSLLAADRRTADAPKRWLGLGMLAAACGLGRPEGLLVTAATVLLGLLWGLAAAGPGTRSRRLLTGIGMALLAAVPVGCHLLWRRLTTGDWLPCTYYAKTLGAWPASGVRYFASFAVEFGVYVWLGWALAWLVRHARRPGPLALLQRHNFGAAAVAGVFLYHFAYYTFYMGGDLFEWRVYTHLIPWLPLSFVSMARAWPQRPGLVLAVFAAFVALAQPIGWIKFAVGDGEVAPHVPSIVRPLVEPYDDWQRWLGDRLVCKRNLEMKVNLLAFERAVPTRAEGERIPWDGFPVIAADAVGVIGWALPNVAIIDGHGLNDPVIARTPIPSAEERLAQRRAWLGNTFAQFDHDQDGQVGLAEFLPWFAILHTELASDTEAQERAARGELARFDGNGDGLITMNEYLQSLRVHGDRMMAHERTAPAGYVEGFRPNVTIVDGKARVEPRTPPLTEAELRAHEALFRTRFGVGR